MRPGVSLDVGPVWKTLLDRTIAPLTKANAPPFWMGEIAPALVISRDFDCFECRDCIWRDEGLIIDSDRAYSLTNRHSLLPALQARSAFGHQQRQQIGGSGCRVCRASPTRRCPEQNQGHRPKWRPHLHSKDLGGRPGQRPYRRYLAVYVWSTGHHRVPLSLKASRWCVVDDEEFHRFACCILVGRIARESAKPGARPCCGRAPGCGPGGCASPDCDAKSLTIGFGASAKYCRLIKLQCGGLGNRGLMRRRFKAA